MDALHWSVPFLCDCVSKMFYALLSQKNQIYDASKENLDEEPTKDEIKEMFSKRISQIMEK